VVDRETCGGGETRTEDGELIFSIDLDIMALVVKELYLFLVLAA
jgi:hypothetical protein